ncbi:MAG: glycosyl hydrolase, partial [Bacteroidales bacterium]|nr:glycosyl hydrolase [Bacteroidales bacterium]
NIHRGDRLTTLVAMDTDPFNGPRDAKIAGMEEGPFANGDVTMTMLRTAKGKTILIEHDVLTPRPYNRMYQLVGTDGYIGKYPIGQVCLMDNSSKEDVNFEDLGREKVYSGAELDSLMAMYPSPILTPELKETAKKVGGHGGMDFIMNYRMVYCLNHGLPLDMDVYDLAEWCCVTELSRISLEHGGAPVEVPDFTRGAWDRIQGFSYAIAE